jgi:hypothetical protein
MLLFKDIIIYLYMASDKIKTFNMIIESFLVQTSELVGTTYYTYFKKITKVNSLIAIENGILFMLPHRNKIFNKDESYFNDESLLINEVNSTPISKKFSSDQILNEIFRLKNIYYKLDDVSKENVWNILQALSQLMIEYCEIKSIKY